MCHCDELYETKEIINATIKFSFDMLKESDEFIHKKSIMQKLHDAKFYYDSHYIHNVFDSVCNKHDVLSLEEFTNFYYIVNNKSEYFKKNNFDIPTGFVIVELTATGTIYFADKH